MQDRLWQNQTMAFGTLIPDNTIAILLGLVRPMCNVVHVAGWVIPRTATPQPRFPAARLSA